MESYIQYGYQCVIPVWFGFVCREKAMILGERFARVAGCAVKDLHCLKSLSAEQILCAQKTAGTVLPIST